MQHKVFVVVFAIVLCSSAAAFPKTTVINRITGQVFDEARNPVPNVHVELLNALDSVLTRTRTNSAGMFSFLGVSSGRFQVRVIPLSEGLIAETKDVEVRPLYSNGSDSVYVDFYLRFDKRTLPPVPRGPGESVFVQEVPSSAQRLYQGGIEKLERGHKDAIKDLKDAVDIFPTYFDALTAIGRELVKQQKYREAYPYLLRALDVNQRSAATYYSLAYAFYKINEFPAALKAIDACLVLFGASSDAHLLRGIILRRSDSFKEAEVALLKALTLSKSPSPEIYWQLAILYNRMGRNAEAVAQLEKYVKVSDSSADKREVEELIGRLKTSKTAPGTINDRKDP